MKHAFKVRLFVLILTVLFLDGCFEKQNKIEVLPDYNVLYKPATDLGIKPEMTGGEDEFYTDEFFARLHELYSPDSSGAALLYTLYINEDGKVDKIQPKGGKRDKRVDELIAGELPSCSFTIARIEGRAVKYQTEWEVYSTKKEFTEAKEKRLYEIQPDVMPMPIGGLAAIIQNVIYPEDAKKNNIEGKVILNVFIDESGKVVSTEILRGAHPLLDKAAEQAVMRTMFTPAKMKGKEVKCQVTLPIVFKLN